MELFVPVDQDRGAGIGSGLAFIMMYYLIHEIGPTRTSMVTYLFPLGGVILGVSLPGEQLS